MRTHPTRGTSEHGVDGKIFVRGLTLAAVILALPIGSSCTSGVPLSHDKVIFQPEPSVGPFVVVAVDNHFHDIHPVDRTQIAESRPFIVKNEGNNLHNFTVQGTNTSIDIQPGGQLVWPRLGDHLGPGNYTVFCKYHVYAGMTGDFIVTP